MQKEDHSWKTNDGGAGAGAWGAGVEDGATWVGGVEFIIGWATGGFWAVCNK